MDVGVGKGADGVAVACGGWILIGELRARLGFALL